MATGYLPSKIVASTDVNKNDSLELILLGGVSRGDQVVVTVYEQELFRHGELASLHVKAFSHFNGFNPARTVIPELQNPADLISDGKNGVLLTMKLEVAELTPPKADRKHQRFSFLPPNDSEITAARPDSLLIAVALGFRAESGDMQFPPASVIRIPQNRFAKNLLLFVVVSHPTTHKIIFSGAIEVSATAPQASHAPKIGGTGRVSGGPPADTSARPDSDVTGIYEAFSEADHSLGQDIPALLIQLNQAGHAVAGWFTRPEENIARQAHLKIKRPQLDPALDGIEQGILLGQFDGQFRFNWGPTESTFIDPSFEKVRNKHTGTIEIIDAATLRLTFRRNGQSATLFLQQREPTARWSNKAMDNLLSRTESLGADRQLRESLHGYQVQPVPLAFWNQLGLDMTEEGVLGQLIIKERRTDSGPAKMHAREKISEYLEGLMGNNLRHRDEMVTQFIRLAAGVEMQIDVEVPPPAGDDKPGNKPLTVLDWLVRIQKEHLDNAGSSLTAEQLLGRADRGFVSMGLVTRHAFSYRLKFHNVGAKIPIGRGFSVGAYAVAVDVTKSILLPHAEPKGDNSFNREATSEASRATIERSAIFLDIGISLGKDFKLGSATGPASEVEFRSVHNLQAKDFDGATFDVISASVLSASNSVFTFFKGPSSMMVVLTVRRNTALPVQLIGSIDKWYSTPSVTGQPFKKHDAAPKFTLVSVSAGKGWLGPRDVDVPDKPTQDRHQPEELGDVNTSVEGFFRVNSASLEARSLAGVEEAMAVDRAMFVSGGGFAASIGYASPEGSDEHNQFLSEKRAEAIQIAMSNAFGKRLAIDAADILVIGRGSRLAEADGMIKPPVPPTMKQKYDQQYRNQFKDYRFVVLNVNGVLVLRMSAGQVTPADEQ